LLKFRKINSLIPKFLKKIGHPSKMLGQPNRQAPTCPFTYTLGRARLVALVTVK
jgi:hypothetical protein